MPSSTNRPNVLARLRVYITGAHDGHRNVPATEGNVIAATERVLVTDAQARIGAERRGSLQKRAALEQQHRNALGERQRCLEELARVFGQAPVRHQTDRHWSPVAAGVLAVVLMLGDALFSGESLQAFSLSRHLSYFIGVLMAAVLLLVAHNLGRTVRQSRPVREQRMAMLLAAGAALTVGAVIALARARFAEGTGVEIGASEIAALAGVNLVLFVGASVLAWLSNDSVQGAVSALRALRKVEQRLFTTEHRLESLARGTEVALQSIRDRCYRLLESYRAGNQRFRRSAVPSYFWDRTHPFHRPRLDEDDVPAVDPSRHSFEGARTSGAQASTHGIPPAFARTRPARSTQRVEEDWR